MRTFFYGLILAAALFPSSRLMAGVQEDRRPHGGAGTNPLIEEMVILDSVFRKVVSAVALGEGARVHRAIEAMHGAMEKTHAGIDTGAITLPKNNDRMKEFVKMDKEFHEKLEDLAPAGERNDQEKMLSLTKQLLGRCVECHRTFRR